MFFRNHNCYLQFDFINNSVGNERVGGGIFHASSCDFHASGVLICWLCFNCAINSLSIIIARAGINIYFLLTKHEIYEIYNLLYKNLHFLSLLLANLFYVFSGFLC